MSRGSVLGLPVAQPIIDQLPAIYQTGLFLTEFTGGLDQVWAPTVTTLDCLHAYLDPSVAPPDFISWLGGWVGLTLDEDWSLERRRVLVSTATELFAKRGTAVGLREEIELYTGGSVSVDDPGAVWTSRFPTDSEQRTERRSTDRTVRVTVDVPDSATVNWPALQVLIRDAVPAHLPVEIELREVAAATETPRRPKNKQKNEPEE